MFFQKNIPNAFTLLNLLCGMMAILHAVEDRLHIASMFILLAVLFDFLDGFSARLLNSQSNIGKQLDSLADMVSFGAAPSFLVFKMCAGTLFLNYTESENILWLILMYSPFLIACASGLRLAKFNLDDEQRFYFKGMPTTVNAFFWSSFPLISVYGNFNEIFNRFLISNPYPILICCYLTCYLMLFNGKLMSMKFKGFGLRDNLEKYILIICGLSLFPFFRFATIPLVVILYLIFSMFTKHQIKNEI